jgi:hypothetical protein
MVTTAPERICARCVMDTTDPEISFDHDGECNHCREYDSLLGLLVSSDEERAERLERLVARIV